MDQDTVKFWKERLGEEYITRNPATNEVIKEAATVFERIFEVSGIQGKVNGILEIGANIGINLKALRCVLGKEMVFAALEPNSRAVEQLRGDRDLDLSVIMHGDASDIHLPDNAYDLVFTNGVLIHVPPSHLPQAMREITRVARRYVLCSEYFSHTPVELPYRGQEGMLWKRDFGRAYLEACPELTIRQYGFLWQEEFPHFDNLNWWVFEKKR